VAQRQKHFVLIPTAGIAKQKTDKENRYGNDAFNDRSFEYAIGP
jgi:hypothetical protein